MKAARERGSSCWVSMICQWVSRAICWLSQTAGDYNYPGAKGGEREACSVNRLPLLSCMDVAHSQGPRSCTSTTLDWTWLLNLFTLGVFSLCNQYSLLLQCAAGTGNDQVTAIIQAHGVFKLSANTGTTQTIITVTDQSEGITTSFAFKTGIFQGQRRLRAFHHSPLWVLCFVSFKLIQHHNWTTSNTICFLHSIRVTPQEKPHVLQVKWQNST